MNITPSFSGQHSWNFTRRGGIFQVQLNTVDERSGVRGGFWAALGLTFIACMAAWIYLWLN